MRIGIFTQIACIGYLEGNQIYQQLPKEKQVQVVNACLDIINRLPDYDLNRHEKTINGHSLHNISGFRGMFNDFIKGLK